MLFVNKLKAAAMGVMFCAFALPAGATTVVIPDIAPDSYVYYGSNNAAVTYDNVTFSENPSLGGAYLYNIGSTPDQPYAVLSSQGTARGVENILVTLPEYVTSFSVDYGVVLGGEVDFLLSNGQFFPQYSVFTGDYMVTSVFSVSSTPFNSVLMTSPDLALNISQISFFSVPEPAAWSLMLIGFFGLGVGLRLRRNLAPSA